MALSIYEDADMTPYKTKKRLVRQFLAKTMGAQELYNFGVQTHNATAMWLALVYK